MPKISITKLLIVPVVGVVLVFMFVPGAQRFGQRLLSDTETIALPDDSEKGPGRTLDLVTLLDYDAIPAILEPDFVSAGEAEAWMDDTEQVLGVSINGDHRAYPIRVLSRYEIVNDDVGGVPIAVTW